MKSLNLLEPVRIVPYNHAFTFKGLCPYCSANLTYTCAGWQCPDEDESGTWLADGVVPHCEGEPATGTKAWRTWYKIHSDLPYERQNPIDRRVERFINKKYRFHL